LGDKKKSSSNSTTMKCDGKQISITNQDPYPVLLVFTPDDEESQVYSYEVPGARLDDETGVYMPITTKVCLKDSLSGTMAIRYTHGNKCVHRAFSEDKWSATTFSYTVPAWNFGDPGEVCRVPENSNSNKNARNSDDMPLDDDDDEAPGNSNEHWWRWFWRRQGKKKINTTHMATMAVVAFIVMVAIVWYMLARRRTK
jgi:hypothetical protein